MLEKTTKSDDRLNWRLPSYITIVALVLFVAIAICQLDISLGLYLFVVAPGLFVTSIVLLIYVVVGKGRGQRLPVLSMLAILWAFSTFIFVYDINHPSAIRSAARWFVWSHDYKNEVLAQPNSTNGELKHVEWDGWGMFEQNTSLFLVYDPTDRLSTAASSHQPGRFSGIPCEVHLVSRLESNWYVVQFYTNESWGQCE